MLPIALQAKPRLEKVCTVRTLAAPPTAHPLSFCSLATLNHEPPQNFLSSLLFAHSFPQFCQSHSLFLEALLHVLIKDPPPLESQPPCSRMVPMLPSLAPKLGSISSQSQSA